MEKFPPVTPDSGLQNWLYDSKQKSMVLAHFRRKEGELPPVMDRRVDVEIPRALWSAWRETGKPRCLRRAPTDKEVKALQRRANELVPWVVGYDASEKTDAAIAVSEMFNAFPAYAMKSAGAGVVAQVESALESLQPYPLWAITKACKSIRTEGWVRRDGIGEYTREMHWPPSEPELIEAVRQAASIYTDTFKNISELLTAEVEQP